MVKRVGKAMPVGKRRSLQVIGRWVARVSRESTLGLGASPEEVQVLQVLVERGPQTPSVLARILGVDFSTAARTVKRLVRSGFAARRDVIEGTSRRPVALTDEGREVARVVSERWEAGFAEVLATLPTLGERMMAYDLAALLAGSMQKLEEGKSGKSG